MTGPTSLTIMNRPVPSGTHMDTLRTHAMVVVDEMVHDNPYHVAPDEFLRGTE
jgi:hypothetical protein